MRENSAVYLVVLFGRTIQIVFNLRVRAARSFVPLALALQALIASPIREFPCGLAANQDACA
jgi:hypothetical protein